MQIQRMLEIQTIEGKRAVIFDLNRPDKTITAIVVSDGKHEVVQSSVKRFRSLDGKKLTFNRTFFGDTFPYVVNFFYGCTAIFCIFAWILHITGRG